MLSYLIILREVGFFSYIFFYIFFTDYKGHYLFSEGKDSGRHDISTIESKTVNLAQKTNLTFWYTMNGRGIGDLSLHQQKGKQSEKLWTLSGRQSEEWQQATIEVGPGKLTFRFRTTVRLPYSSDIAIDDVQLESEAIGKASDELKLTSYDNAGVNQYI